MRETKAHLFAFWYPTLSTDLAQTKAVLIIRDTQLITRFTSVVRLTVGESCILFDKTQHVVFTITDIAKKTITGSCTGHTKNTRYEPSITALLPLLKKDDLATALVELTAVGVTAIQLVLTEGVQRAWGGSHELERLQRVMIASAEQSKNFSLPELFEPLSLVQALARHPFVIWGDPEGKPYRFLFQELPVRPQNCAIMVGPESDFTEAEKQQLRAHKTIGYALTPTILRSYLAITIIAASVRSWYYGKEL